MWCRCSYENWFLIWHLALTLAGALAEPVDATVREVAAWQSVGEWLGLADVILDKEGVGGVTKDSLSAQLES